MLNIFNKSKYQKDKNALIVSGRNDNDNADLIRMWLNKFGYKIKSIENKRGQITKSQILSEVEELVNKDSEQNSHFIYFSGHGYGENNGDNISGIGFFIKSQTYNERIDVNKEVLLPEEIFSLLANTKAKKAMIFDTCFGGMFLEYQKATNVLNNYVMISPTTNNKSILGINKNIGSRKLFISPLTYGLHLLFKEKGDHANLSTDSIKVDHMTQEEKDFWKQMVCVGDDKYSHSLERICDCEYKI